MASDITFIEHLQNLPIHGQRQSFTIQMTKIERIVTCKIINFIRTQPKDFELTMFTYLFIPFVPHENKITCLEILLESLLVEICLYIFLILCWMIKGAVFDFHQA
jgi:hypothetical protein